MENNKLKNEIKNFDIKSVDNETFGKSLLMCVPKIKYICAHLDAKIYGTALTSYAPYVSTMDQYDDIIENIVIKKQLLIVYQVFKEWYNGLSANEKTFYKYHFVKRDRSICADAAKNSKFRLDLHMGPMIRSFMDCLRVELNFKERELLRNPFIYQTYMNLSNKKKRKAS